MFSENIIQNVEPFLLNRISDKFHSMISFFIFIIQSLPQYHKLLSLYLITFLFSLTPPPPPSKFTFRHTKNINIIEFNNDLTSSNLILHPPTSLPELLDSYNSTLRSVLDKHAPLITKLSKPCKSNPWYNPALLALT